MYSRDTHLRDMYSRDTHLRDIYSRRDPQPGRYSRRDSQPGRYSRSNPGSAHTAGVTRVVHIQQVSSPRGVTYSRCHRLVVSPTTDQEKDCN